MQVILTLAVPGFLSIRVLSFRPGSVVAELEVTLDSSSGSGADEVVDTLRQNISPTGVLAGSDLVVDPNSIQIIAGEQTWVLESEYTLSKDPG